MSGAAGGWDILLPELEAGRPSAIPFEPVLTGGPLLWQSRGCLGVGRFATAVQAHLPDPSWLTLCLSMIEM